MSEKAADWWEATKDSYLIAGTYAGRSWVDLLPHDKIEVEKLYYDAIRICVTLQQPQRKKSV